MSNRERDSTQIKESLEYADVAVSSLQSAASVLDNDAMQISRLWETLYAQSSGSSDQYGGRTFSSGRVAFSVPSSYFDSLSNRAVVEAGVLDALLSEFLKIEEFYAHMLKEGRRPSEIEEKVRQAMLQQIAQLKAK